jgi:crotonobetaine/carnitine-CoA ligase
VDERDVAMLLFTSGTTGPSKGCVLSHRYAIRQGELLAEHLRITSSDVLYSPFPLFHADAATLTVVPAMVMGATAALGRRFSASGFWEEVRAFEATVFDFMGATLSILWKQPRRSDDSDNPVRLAWGVPMPAWADEFEARFGLKLLEVYGLTDAGVVAFYPYDEERRPGACGRPVHPYDVRVFDADDRELHAGQIGEIVVRPLEPSVTMAGYHGMPSETLSVFRNLWLHTGDRGYFDDDGYLYFVGRNTDSIRRRGENISAFEIEEVVLAHPDIVEAAAVGVPSELTEEDVKLCIVPRAGARISPRELIEFCKPRMARFMLPRYVEVMTELPRTQTQKVEKYRLRAAGVSSGTWDREREGAHR